jgi:hypothetical protein
MSVPRSGRRRIRASKVRFICSGDVRGECGVSHLSRFAAEACINRDHRACARQGGYSDRMVVMVTTRGDQ